jgi:hypothetical protein
MKQNTTVCKEGFNWLEAHLFCQSIGYWFADWGSIPEHKKYYLEK